MSEREVAQVDPLKPELNLDPNKRGQSKMGGDLLLHGVPLWNDIDKGPRHLHGQ